MALDWLPVAPDQISRDTTLGAPYGPAYAGASVRQVELLARLWGSGQPTFPALIWRTPWQVPAGLTQPLTTGGAAPTPALSWAPTYPAQIARSRLPVAAQSTLFQTPRSLFLDLGWLPAAVYPHAIPRLAWHPSQQESEHQLTAPLVPPPALSWQPIYPAQIRPTLTLRTGNQIPFTFYVQPVPAPDPPGLGYQTAVFPTFLLPRRSLPVPSQQVFGENLLPIPRPAPPTELTWQPVYPAQIWVTLRRPALLPQAVGGGVFEPAVVASTLKWLPTVAERPRPVWPAVLFTPVPPVLLGTQAAIATYAWRAITPVRMPASVWPMPDTTVLPPVVPAGSVAEPACATPARPVAGASGLSSGILGTPLLAFEFGGEGLFTAEVSC